MHCPEHGEVELEIVTTTRSNVELSHIPADELWLWNNPELSAKFARANIDLKEGQGTRVSDINAYLDGLECCLN